MASKILFASRLWSKLTAPSNAVKSPLEIRRAKLLSGLLLTIFFIGIPVAYIHPVLSPILIPGLLPRIPFIRFAIILTLYLISRTRYYRWAGALIVALLSVLIVAGVIEDGTTGAESYLIFLLLPVVLSSILFPLWTTVFVALVNSAGTMLVQLVRPDILSLNLTVQVVGVIVITSILLVLAMRERLVIEHDQQTVVLESAQQMKATFDQATVGISHYSLDGRYLRVNQRFCEVVGYSAEELLQKNYQEITHPDDIGISDEHLQRLVIGAAEPFFEKRYLRKDGSIVWVNLAVSLVRGADNSPKYFIAFIDDITERKAAVAALRESEERFSKIFHSSPVATLIVLSEDGKIVEANPAFERLSGYERHELLGRSGIDLQFYDAETLGRLGKEIKEKGAIHNFEIELRTQSAVPRWVLATTDPITLNGKSSRLTTMYDITDRKAAEEAQHESEERFSKIFYQSPVGIAISRQQDGRYVEANQAYLDMLGYQRRELIGHTGLELQIIDPAARAKNMDRLKQEGVLQNLESYMRTKSGEHRWVLSSTETITLAGELCYLSILHDITQRIEGEAALRESEERFSKVFQGTPVGIIITQMDSMKFLEVNPACERLLGYRRDELIGHTSLEVELIDPEDRQHMLEAFQREGRIENVEIKIRGKSGQHRWVLIGLENITLNGEPCALNIFIDIHDRKLAEEEIRRLNAELEERVNERTVRLTVANKELEAFSYSVSHDLRAPLRAVDGFSQALMEDYGGKLDDEAQHYIQRIRAGSQRMGALIDDMLKLSRVTRSEIQLETVDMSALARKIAADLQASQPERRAEFMIQEGLTVQADSHLLRLALENLLSNAWKFTGKQGLARIAFYSEEQQEERVFVVEDNGVGFDMAYADKLFGAFQRLHPASEFEGTGVGLATVQRVIHRHNGRVWAKSAPGQGTAFYFTL
jgi:PAS domain S-box-containing protein